MKKLAKAARDAAREAKKFSNSIHRLALAAGKHGLKAHARRMAVLSLNRIIEKHRAAKRKAKIARRVSAVKSEHRSVIGVYRWKPIPSNPKGKKGKGRMHQSLGRTQNLAVPVAP